MKGDINLLKNELEKKGPLSFRPGLGSLYGIIGILLIEMLCYGGLVFYNKYLHGQMAKSEQAASGIDSEISKLDVSLKQAVSYQSRLASLSIMLDHHIFWSAVLDELEKYIYRPVVLETLEADQTSHIFNVSGVAGSYTEIGKVILSLKKSPRIQDVELLETHSSDSERAGYSFTLRVTFDPQLLLK